ncbi:hypothetical protein CJ030_MR1G022236 [Morella rubra]|uniref:Protein RAE1 n=1 Tax=Morella rubra TaxID=262757 RepID=A0A6A1WP48_9ROSI|nr:hypothetical protein CJ030_MR1G022236 [Morella rubra]
MATFGTAAAPNPNPNKSFEVAQPPSDSVSSLSFSPKANYLVATSWDNQVRCWEIMHSGAAVGSTPKASISLDQPVLCSTWKDDGTTVFSGGCDKQAKMWPLSGGQPMTVAMHDAPIKEIAWIPEMNLLATGSDMYWDTRQSNPVHTQQLPDRCYSLTVRHPLMVVGTADRNLVVFNLQNPQTEFKRITSPLKYQTRCVTAFPDQQGFLVGSIEGRVGVHHLDDSQQSKNFTFKCHRDGSEIYSVNSLNFHPAMARCLQPIPCSTFNNDGSIYAYAVCYDWSKGAENHNPAAPKPSIFLHLPQVDVWSAGILFYQMLFGKRPSGHDQTQERILREDTIIKARKVEFPSRPAVSNEAKVKTYLMAQDQTESLKEEDDEAARFGDRNLKIMHEPVDKKIKRLELTYFYKFKALHKALYVGNWDAVDRYLNHDMAALNAKVFRSGETALHIAVAKGHVHIVEEVGGANVGGGFRIRDGSGMTAMARASALGGTPMLECMHKKNKNLHTVPDPTGRIPFLVALEAGNKEAARYFYSVTPKENLIGDANDELDSSLISALILENNLGNEL